MKKFRFLNHKKQAKI